MVGNIHSRFAYCTSSACKIQNEENPQFQILEGAGLLCRTLFYLLGEMPIGERIPLEADKWSRLCDLSVYDKYEFRWYGPYLCLGDAKKCHHSYNDGTGSKICKAVLYCRMV